MRRNGYLWTSCVNFDSAIRFADPDFLLECKIFGDLATFSVDFYILYAECPPYFYFRFVWLTDLESIPHASTPTSTTATKFEDPLHVCVLELWVITFAYHWQEAQLSPRDRAMRRVNGNLANCHTTVQKLLMRQVLTKSMVWSWTFSRRQCVIDNVHSTMTRSSRLPLSQVS